MKKSRVIISNKARESLKSYIDYLKKEESLETAEYVRQGILSKCRQLKEFSGF